MSFAFLSFEPCKPAFMHDDEIPCDTALVRRLIGEAFPDWAALPVRPVASTGTDNWLFRLGDTLAVRLPRRPSAAALLDKEWTWLPQFSGLPLEVPLPHARGLATGDFPYPYSVVPWIDGDLATPDNLGDPVTAALTLAGFLQALQVQPAHGAPPAGDANHMRGVDLSAMDARTRPAMAACADEMDLAAAERLWQAALEAGPRQGAPVWLHGDLKADNLLARQGRLVAVLDWGLAAVGDPAADYACAWTWVAPEARTAFRVACGASDADWARAKGWALYGAVIALSYYRGGRNEALCATCRATLGHLGLR